VILLQIHQVTLRPELIFPVAMPWLLFALSAGAIWFAARVMRLPPLTAGALILTAGLANTSFVGLPMIETFYGERYQAIGILIDQLGTYLVLSTVGIGIACLCSRGTTSYRDVLWRIVTFPPLIALTLAFVLVPVSYPVWLSDILARLGGTLAPLALVSVGLQLRLDGLRARLRPLAVGLSLKLLVAPLVLAILYLGVLRATGITMRVTLFEAAMGPMIGGAIVATQHGLDPPLVSLMVGIGTLAAFATLPMWWYLLQTV
jgi:hypothetical protein